MSDKLKPCPFCGGEATLRYDEELGEWKAECRECMAEIHDCGSEDGAVMDWNNRAIEDELESEIRLLEEFVDRITKQIEQVAPHRINGV